MEEPQIRRPESKRKTTPAMERKKSHASSLELKQVQSSTTTSSAYNSKYKPSQAVQDFYKQIKVNREYLGKFDSTLTEITNREKYRNYLNEKFYEKVLLNAEKAHDKALEDIENFKKKEREHAV